MRLACVSEHHVVVWQWVGLKPIADWMLTPAVAMSHHVTLFAV